MSTSFCVILCLQLNLVLNLIADKPNLDELIEHNESAHWPLQAGYPGLAINNLNEYVSLFSQCLVKVQNFQGIEIIGIKSPVWIYRFDVANLERCWDPSSSDRNKVIYRFFFDKIPSKSEQNCTTDYDNILKYSDKSLSLRWYCTAEFDIFFPEPADAPHIVYHSQLHDFTGRRYLSDISSEYTQASDYRDNWSKLFLI